MRDKYDLAVIGAGPGGYTAAIRAARCGLSVALIEEREAGGTCLNRGCIPTKTLLHSAHLLDELGFAQEFGIVADGIRCDIPRIYARKDTVVKQLRQGVEQLVAANGIDIFEGRGQITSLGEVEVRTGEETAKICAENILIATGASPVLPPIPGVELPGVVTSDQLLESLPDGCERITIIGGGVIGVEFATLFMSLGLEVTIIEAANRLLPTMDREIGQNLAMLFKKRGVMVQAGASVLQITEQGRGLVCRYAVGDKTLSAESDLVLVAVGRRANTAELFKNMPEGLVVERGAIVVDEKFKTGAKGIYAIGDVVSGGVQLAHVAAAHGLCAVAHIKGEPEPVDLGVVPACIYTDPEIASVGITEAQAKAAGIKVVTSKYPMRGNGRSVIAMQERGFIKVIAKADSERILGAHLFCTRATDLVSEFATAIANRLTVAQMMRTIRPHPTFCEGISEALENFHGLATHMMPAKK